MTGRELIKYIEENHFEDYDVRQYNPEDDYYHIVEPDEIYINHESHYFSC